ncbi:MAG TPA: serine/threonine-protein kinase, partial [Oculatellaceae cyanobacterium]
FFVMPLLKGQTLSELLRNRKDLPLLEKLDILIDICSGLVAAHAAGIVHRDLKPSNIMVLPWTTSDEEICGQAPPYPEIDPKRLPERMHKIVLVDFGIAKILPRGDVDTQVSTTTGDVFGTPLYMSPEQCLGDQALINERSDIYAMGCLMYEVLTGSPAYIGKQHIDTMNWHMGSERPPLENIPGARSSTIEQLNPIVAKAFRRHAEERWQSMEQLRRELLSVKANLVKGYLQEPQVKALGKSLEAAQDAKSHITIFGRKMWKRLAESARKNIVLICVVLVLAAFAINVTPDVMTKDPSTSMNDIAWAAVPPPPLRNAEQFRNREKDLSFAYRTEQSSGPISPELFGTLKDSAELYYENQLYPKAAALYSSALKIGKELEEKGIETQTSEMAAISLPAAFCFYRIGNYDGAFTFCETGLDLAKKGNTRVGKPIFFRGILAGSYSHLVEARHAGPKYMEIGARNAKANATVFMALLRQDDFKPEESYEIGLLASDVGDYYLRSGDLKMAAEAYKYALRAWTSLDEAGRYNRAVANVRLGLVRKQEGNLREASDTLEKAVSLFAAEGVKDDLVRARTMFCLADAYWQMKDYWRATLTRRDAVRVWRGTKKA